MAFALVSPLYPDNENKAGYGQIDNFDSAEATENYLKTIEAKGL
jgi:hypothetical protein